MVLCRLSLLLAFGDAAFVARVTRVLQCRCCLLGQSNLVLSFSRERAVNRFFCWELTFFGLGHKNQTFLLRRVFGAMAGSIELSRACLEEVERLENVIVKDLDLIPNGHKERLQQQHRVKAVLL